MRETGLLFVYNADGGLFNTLSDFGHKIFSPHTYECRLCALTYGWFSERKEWRAFVEGLGLPCTFLHRDAFRRRYPDSRDALPAVFRLFEGRPVVCLDADQIKACKDLEALRGLVRQRCLGEGAG